MNINKIILGTGNYENVKSGNTVSITGDRVNAGDVVALSGNEGISTGPHLHLQIEDSDGNLLNSEYLFEDCWPE